MVVKNQTIFKKTEKLNTEEIPNFEYGVIWEDPISGHRVGYLDVSKKEDVEKLMLGNIEEELNIKLASQKRILKSSRNF